MSLLANESPYMGLFLWEVYLGIDKCNFKKRTDYTGIRFSNENVFITSIYRRVK